MKQLHRKVIHKNRYLHDIMWRWFTPKSFQCSPLSRRKFRCLQNNRHRQFYCVRFITYAFSVFLKANSFSFTIFRDYEIIRVSKIYEKWWAIYSARLFCCACARYSSAFLLSSDISTKILDITWCYYLSMDVQSDSTYYHQ